MHEWHIEESEGLDQRLKALRLLPHFFNPLPLKVKFQKIDCNSMIDSLQSLTWVVESQCVGDSAGNAKKFLWLGGATTRLLMEFVTLHIQSYSPQSLRPTCRKQAREPLLAPWAGISAANGLYLHCILGFWNAGQPIETRLHMCILRILLRDCHHMLSEIGSERTRSSDLWFWKAFVGLFSITKRDMSANGVAVEELALLYKDLVRHWSNARMVSEWEMARKCLEDIIWPRPFWEDDIAKGIWENAVADRVVSHG